MSDGQSGGVKRKTTTVDGLPVPGSKKNKSLSSDVVPSTSSAGATVDRSLREDRDINNEYCRHLKQLFNSLKANLNRERLAADRQRVEKDKLIRELQMKLAHAEKKLKRITKKHASLKQQFKKN